MALSEATREQPLAELVGGIASDVETLVQKELTLTGQTIRDDLSTMRVRAGLSSGRASSSGSDSCTWVSARHSSSIRC